MEKQICLGYLPKYLQEKPLYKSADLVTRKKNDFTLCQLTSAFSFALTLRDYR